MKKRTCAALAAFALTASTSVAMAQGEEDPFDPASEDGTADPYSSEPTPSSEPAGPSTSSSSTGYKMAFSTAFPTGGDAAAANLLWGLDPDTFLNLRLGFDFEKGEVIDPMDPTMTTSETRVGFFAGAGYRMYKPTEGKIRPYLEPGAFVGVADFSDFGPSLSIGVGATLGVDYQLLDQFTIGMGIGAGLTFSDEFNTIDLGLITRNINATFWW